MYADTSYCVIRGGKKVYVGGLAACCDEKRRYGGHVRPNDDEPEPRLTGWRRDAAECDASDDY